MMRFSRVLALGVGTLLALTLGAAHAVGPHPMDPLTPEEISAQRPS
jgi:hypothetical protein